MRVKKQWDLKDCGVACLAFIIETYGGYVSREKLREDTYTNQQGTNAFYMQEALKKYGFDVVSKKIEIKDLMEVPFKFENEGTTFIYKEPEVYIKKGN